MQTTKPRETLELGSAGRAASVVEADHRRRDVTTIPTVLVFLLVSLNSFAQTPTGPPEDEPGKTAWIVTLKPGVSVDFRGLGARSVGSRGRHIFVQMPEGAARALARDPRVESLQKMVKALGGGEPARVDPEPQRGSGANGELPMESATTGTMNPSVVGDWSSGPYSYDGSGNIVSIGPNGDGKTDWYRYDGLSRLVEATANTATANNRETYEYDGFGNMTRKRTYAEGATTPQADSQTSVNSGTNQVTTWAYDAAGSLTADTMHQFAWDPFRMLEQVYNGYADEFYVYTASDERIGTKHDSGEWWTWELRDLSGRVVRQWSYWWGWYEWERDYVYRDGAVLGGSTTRGKRHFHVDHLGTPRLITDATGTQISRHVYYPFGVEATSIQQEVVTGARIDDPAKFTGHERDFLSWGDGENVDYLDYMHARTYTPVGARFLSVDPAMDIKKTMANPRMWNRYSYVVNNPIRYTDPDGRLGNDGLAKPMNAENLAMDENTPVEIKAAFYAEAFLLSAVVGEAGFAGAIETGRATFRLIREPTLRRDITMSGGRSGSDVKSLAGPPNSVTNGGAGRIFKTDGQGRVIADITRDRVKPVTPGVGFGPKRSPTAQELVWLNKMAKGSWLDSVVRAVKDVFK